MLHYDSRLKSNSRQLRRSLTDSEALMWFKLRRKQILGVQFYRQKPIGNYIVDFYAPKVRLIVELDGSQHFLPKQQAYDSKRELYLKAQGLAVIRFHNLQVLQETSGVMEVIYRIVYERLRLPGALPKICTEAPSKMQVQPFANS